MSFLKHTFIILSILLCFGQSFAINQYKHFESGVWGLQSQMTYQKSKSNFNTSGKISDLPKSNYFQLIDITTGARYGMSESINAYGHFNIGNAESNGTDAVRTNSTLNKVILGGEALVGDTFPQIIPEIAFVLDLEKVNENQDNVMNSEGANELTGKLNLQFDLRPLFIFGYIGYSYRDKGRSHLLPWNFNAETTFSDFTLGGEIFGFQSITSDKDKGATEEVARDALRSRVNGGSAKFYSINPSVVDFNVYLKTGWGQSFVFWLAGGIPLMGNNYANDLHAEAGLKWTFGAESVKSFRRKEISIPVNEESRISTDKKVEKFREDTNDGVDQRMFKATPTAPARKVITKPAHTAPDESLREKMDDAEFKIQLRSNKKKRKRP